MTWDSIALKIVEILLPVFGLLLTALIAYGVAYLRKQTQKLSNEVVRDALYAALAEAEQQAANAVKATNQVLVDELKAAREDGKLTEAEKKQALEMAKNIFLANISNGALETLKSGIGPIEQWLTGLLEAKVAEVKQENMAAKLANPT